jgi:2-succinyl-6-hydroxy-2,4-cyclohexadiene-1-carboxylate synthase
VLLIGIISGVPSPEILFLPGFMQRADAWAEVAEAVGQRYPSKVLDFGTWTFEERLGEIDGAAAPGAVVVGYSMGGRLALHAALGAAGRFSGLVLVGASPGIEGDQERAARAVADDELAAWIETHSIEEVVERWERNPVFATQPAELVAAQRPGRLAHSPADLARLLRSAGQGALPSLWDRLGELRIPVLAVAGAHDRDYAARAERMASLSSSVAAEIVPDAGHAAHLEQPAIVRDAILAFVEGLTPP